MKAIFFSDVDGTFLDDDYSYNSSLEGLVLLQQRGIPLCLISSKTFEEMVELVKELDIICPFGFENGAGIGYPGVNGFSCKIFSDIMDLICEVIPLIEKVYGNPICLLKDLSAAEISKLTGLSLKRATLAKERRTSVPFITASGGKLPENVLLDLNNLLSEHGLVVTQGARFNHILKKGIDKGFAVQKIKEFYCDCIEFPVTAAAGDSSNDVAMLEAVNRGYIVRKNDGSYMDLGEEFIITQGAGPYGFVEAVKDFLCFLNFC